MKPLAMTKLPGALPGFVNEHACKAGPVPTARDGLGIPFIDVGNGAVSCSGWMRGISGCTGHVDAGLARARERTRRTRPKDTILLKTGEKQ